MNFCRTKYFKVLQQQVRFMASTKPSQKRKNMKILVEPPADRTTDYIGPPHPISNLRPVQAHIPANETKTEKEYRLRRASVMEWNQQFWSHHNHNFFKGKNDFVKQHKNDKDGDGKRTLSPQEMSVFYKQFLDTNRSSHLQYNKEWYKKNISLLWPAVKVAGIRVLRSLRSRNKPHS